MLSVLLPSLPVPWQRVAGLVLEPGLLELGKGLTPSLREWMAMGRCAVQGGGKGKWFCSGARAGAGVICVTLVQRPPMER